MILSVSRRTDIPNYYSDWFYNRIKEGYCLVRNPMNAHQISRIKLTPDVIDCIVFWTKNPRNMMDRLDEIKEYNYYFQFTITGYGRDVEPGVEDKNEVVMPTFIDLAKKIGKEKVIWRYDPILLNDKYTKEYHLRAFSKIAEKLEGYTDKVVISFVDTYAKTQRNMKPLNMQDISVKDMIDIAGRMVDIAKMHGMTVESCAEAINLSGVGVEHGCCIDSKLIERIIGAELKGKKDKNQREECGCFESIEIGSYNTCRNGCRYCYANFNDAKVAAQSGEYDPESPILCGHVESNDKITDRKIESSVIGQIELKL